MAARSEPGDHKFYIANADNPWAEYYTYPCSGGFYPTPAATNHGTEYYNAAITASTNGMLFGFLTK